MEKSVIIKVNNELEHLLIQQYIFGNFNWCWADCVVASEVRCKQLVREYDEDCVGIHIEVVTCGKEFNSGFSGIMQHIFSVDNKLMISFKEFMESSNKWRKK